MTVLLDGRVAGLVWLRRGAGGDRRWPMCADLSHMQAATNSIGTPLARGRTGLGSTITGVTRYVSKHGHFRLSVVGMKDRQDPRRGRISPTSQSIESEVLDAHLHT